jgi:hypothetical protein
MQLAREYNSALEEFALAAAELRRQADDLRKFADAVMKAPGRACFSSFDGEQEPPLSAMIAGNHWSVDEFPTPQSLQSALRQRELVKRKLHSIWKNLPAAARAKLTAPPRR